MITIQNVEVTLEVEGDDAQAFLKHFVPAVNAWYRQVKEREESEEESRRDRSLQPPPRR